MHGEGNRFDSQMNDGIEELETVLKVDPNHRGVREFLAYAYAATGQMDKLRDLPPAPNQSADAPAGAQKATAR